MPPALRSLVPSGPSLVPRPDLGPFVGRSRATLSQTCCPISTHLFRTTSAEVWPNLVKHLSSAGRILVKVGQHRLQIETKLGHSFPKFGRHWSNLAESGQFRPFWLRPNFDRASVRPLSRRRTAMAERIPGDNFWASSARFRIQNSARPPPSRRMVSDPPPLAPQLSCAVSQGLDGLFASRACAKPKHPSSERLSPLRDFRAHPLGLWARSSTPVLDPQSNFAFRTCTRKRRLWRLPRGGPPRAPDALRIAL